MSGPETAPSYDQAKAAIDHLVARLLPVVMHPPTAEALRTVAAYLDAEPARNAEDAAAAG